MGRSDDSISRRRSKKIRKKEEEKKDASSKVSRRVAAFIAAKKRRQSGKRRQCEGMCFSLPTPEDPFNDRKGKPEHTRKRKREAKEDRKLTDKKSPRLKESTKDNVPHKHLHEDKFAKSQIMEKGKTALVSSISFMGSEIATNLGKPTHQIIKREGSNHYRKELVSDHISGSPSKFLIACLNTIQNALYQGTSSSVERDKPLYDNAWGIEFFNSYCAGKDVLESSGADSKLEQIAWIASTAADTISMKEKEGASFTGPFLLYLVPSQQKASEVRGVCKPLKALGIHTVSLHSGTSIDHQINGLNNCEPQLAVSTPERLLELLSLKAVDISGVSLLVIDGLKNRFSGSYFEAVESIRRYISGSPRTVVFWDCMNNSSTSVMQKMLAGSVCE